MIDQGLITIEQMVQREVLCCMSSLVSTLDQSHALSSGHFNRKSGLADLIEQAHELAAPVLDYEEGARDRGWKWDGKKWFHAPPAGEKCLAGYYVTADELYGNGLIEAYEWEVYEHWAISQWLADKLIAQGERVDTDFASLNIWARTTTGQSISMDGCIQHIYADMTKPCVAEGEARVAPHTLDSVAPGA